MARTCLRGILFIPIPTSSNFFFKLSFFTFRTAEEEDQLGGAVFYCRLQDMLPRCDFVVIACPLTMATENLIGAKEFALMKPNAILINVARGKVYMHAFLYRFANFGMNM